MRVVQVKCPKCELPLHLETPDKLLYCSNCGTIHTRKEQRVERIPYEIAGYREGSLAGDHTYMPFWRLRSDFHIRSGDAKGGFFSMMGQTLRGDGMSGPINLYVPAVHMDIAAFRYWVVNLTINNPCYIAQDNFAGIRRAPAIIDREEAMELADFVAMTLEAERPGTLQHLDHSLTVTETMVVYLPFISGSSGQHLALSCGSRSR